MLYGTSHYIYKVSLGLIVMLFMVKMKIELPGEMDSKLVSELRSAELDRAIELIKAGKL